MQFKNSGLFKLLTEHNIFNVKDTDKYKDVLLANTYHLGHLTILENQLIGFRVPFLYLGRGLSKDVILVSYGKEDVMDIADTLFSSETILKMVDTIIKPIHQDTVIVLTSDGSMVGINKYSRSKLPKEYLAYLALSKPEKHGDMLIRVYEDRSSIKLSNRIEELLLYNNIHKEHSFTIGDKVKPIPF